MERLNAAGLWQADFVHYRGRRGLSAKGNVRRAIQPALVRLDLLNNIHIHTRETEVHRGQYKRCNGGLHP